MATGGDHRGEQMVPHTVKEPGFLTNAERKKNRIEREKVQRELKHAEENWEESSFGGKIFSILSHGFTLQLADVCTPPITSSEMARCLGLNPEGKSIRRLYNRSVDKNARGLSRNNAIIILEAAYKAGRLDQSYYIRLKRAVSPSGANVSPNRRKVTRMVEILSRKVLKLSA